MTRSELVAGRSDLMSEPRYTERVHSIPLRTSRSVALKFIIRRKASLISNQIMDEFVAVLKDWKIIFDSYPVALGYVRS